MQAFLLITVIIAIGALAIYAMRLFARSRLITTKVPPRYTPIIESALRWLIIIAVLVISMRIGGVTMSTVIASISAFSLVAAVAFFAYWSVLSNALCSLMLLLFQPFRVGDRIEVLEHQINIVAAGTVEGINLIYVTLSNVAEDGSESLYRIPSNLLFQRTLRVWQGDETRSLGEAYAENKRKEAVPEEQESLK